MTGRARDPESPSFAEGLSFEDSPGRTDSLSAFVAGTGAPAGRLTTRQDTVRADVVRRSRPATMRVSPIVRPKEPIYTVQIGAFTRASNALRFEQLARSRLQDHQVFNRFNKTDRLYRISVGRFGDKKAATSLRRAIMQQYAKDYHDAWVIYATR